MLHWHCRFFVFNLTSEIFQIPFLIVHFVVFYRLLCSLSVNFSRFSTPSHTTTTTTVTHATSFACQTQLIVHQSHFRTKCGCAGPLSPLSPRIQSTDTWLQQAVNQMGSQQQNSSSFKLHDFISGCQGSWNLSTVWDRLTSI